MADHPGKSRGNPVPSRSLPPDRDGDRNTRAEPRSRCAPTGLTSPNCGSALSTRRATSLCTLEPPLEYRFPSKTRPIPGRAFTARDAGDHSVLKSRERRPWVFSLVPNAQSCPKLPGVALIENPPSCNAYTFVSLLKQETSRGFWRFQIGCRGWI